MSKVMELGIVVGASASGALTGLAKVADGITKVKDNTEKLAATAKKLENFDKAREKLNELNKKYLESAVMLKKLKEEYSRTGKGNVEFAKKVKEAEKYVDKLNKQKEAQRHAFQRARSSIEEEGHSLKTYRETLLKVNRELEINKKLKKIQANYDNQVA